MTTKKTKCLFDGFNGLPMDMCIEIMIRVPPSELGSLRLVSKNWRDSLRESFVRKLQIMYWRRSGPSFLMSCEQTGLFPARFRVLQIFKSPSMLNYSEGVIDNNRFHDMSSFTLEGVQDGILCIQYRDLDLVPRLMLCNPLTKKMRSIDFPKRVPDRCMNLYFLCFGCYL